MKHSKTDNVIVHERSLEFWFSNRQPRYQADFVERYGEWWDDMVFKPEERAEDLDEEDFDL